MQETGKTKCIPCSETVPVIQAGTEFGASPYEIIADGSSYGIRFQGEIRIHGLEFGRAQYLISILNSITGLPPEMRRP